MVFSHHMAALAAVVAIPLGVAATSYALTDSPDAPSVPPMVVLDSGSPSATPTSPEPTPSDEVVSRPPVSDNARSSSWPTRSVRGPTRCGPRAWTRTARSCPHRSRCTRRSAPAASSSPMRRNAPSA
ncbi:hypothetical protein ABT009_21425 [Streptomyces sp. NPDC002896]|uniref:hypothetical protein n=1 Tax=Streptomyces sp. NPDC002896 TaxID=3154438 RepID=UPI00331F40E1